MVSGVYRFRHKETNKAYIGSSYNVERRYKEHTQSCRKGSWMFYRAVDKYGIDAFEYEVIEPIENTNNLPKKEFRQYIYEREQVWLDMYYAQEFVESNKKDRRFRDTTYNIKPLVDKSVGQEWSEESKQKRKDVYKLWHPVRGRKRTQEHIDKINKTREEKGGYKGERNPNYGKKSTQEKKAKYRETKKEKGSITEFYRIDKDLKIEGPFYGVTSYAKEHSIEPRGITYCIKDVDRCRKYKDYTYCTKVDIEDRVKLIQTHPNFWGYYKFKKEYYQERKNKKYGKV